MNSAKRLSLLSIALILCSCAMPDLTASTGTHCIKLKDGSEVLCDGEPRFQDKTGYYRYRTFQKRDAVVRKDDVLAIEKSA